MTDSLQLYRELILKHSRCTKHIGPLSEATGSATLHNPLCGDTITVHVQLDEDGHLIDARYEVQGCAIAKAVASLLIERVKGRHSKQLHSWAAQSHASVNGKDELGFPELAAMAELPARKRCATLPWDSLAAALKNSKRPAEQS